MEAATDSPEVEVRKGPEAEGGREEGEVLPREFPQCGMSGKIEWINDKTLIVVSSVTSEAQRL